MPRCAANLSMLYPELPLADAHLLLSEVGAFNANVQMDLDHCQIVELSFDGWVACEYRPHLGDQAGGTSAGLGWMKQWQPG